MSKDGGSQSSSIYTASIEKAMFNQNLSTVYVPSQQILTLVQPGKEIQVKSIIKEQIVNLPF